MDIFKWIKTHRLAILTIFAVVFLIIPFSVDKLYSVHAKYKILEMTYTASDILSFYGITLGSATTILALVETIQHTEKLHELDYMRKLTPVLDSNIYNHTAFSHTPLRLLYVNVRPAAYLNRVSVSTSIDPRDLEDIFHGAQIDYLIQNITKKIIKALEHRNVGTRILLEKPCLSLTFQSPLNLQQVMGQSIHLRLSFTIRGK